MNESVGIFLFDAKIQRNPYQNQVINVQTPVFIVSSAFFRCSSSDSSSVEVRCERFRSIEQVWVLVL